MDNDQQQYQLDLHEVRRAFDQAAAAYDANTPLQAMVRERVLERLELADRAARCVLDAGCGTGVAIPALAKLFRKAELHALDIAPAMLRVARKRKPWFRKLQLHCADMTAMPLPDSKVDVLYSSLALQWLNDLDAALAEFARVMRPKGLLVFSTFGPDTLKELRSVFASVDGYTHVNRFLDLHDIGDALVRHGFREVVMDVEHFTVTYDTVRDLMRDLKIIGAHNATQGRARGLMGKQRFQAIEREYEKLRVDGKLPLSYEVVYGTAWAPDELHLPPGAVPASKGVISVDALRAGLRAQSKGGGK